MSSVLVDTGIWYAICDQNDTALTRDQANAMYDQIKIHEIVVPWPILYEVLWSGFVRKPLAMERFEQEFRTLRITRLDDKPYRDDAYQLSIESSRGIRRRPLSMVDCVLRLMMDDKNIRIRYMATINEKDFVDVCTKRQIDLWSEKNLSY